jgi:hypothetical protein
MTAAKRAAKSSTSASVHGEPDTAQRRPKAHVVDRHGQTVSVGTRVRMLEVAESLRLRVSRKEWAELEAMVGLVFTVDEIDEYGSAWVREVRLSRKGEYKSGHHYALDAHEMEVVDERP